MKHFVFYCNVAWLQYQLGSQEKWPKNGSFSYLTSQLFIL
jgi:hypothetical protein